MKVLIVIVGFLIAQVDLIAANPIKDRIKIKKRSHLLIEDQEDVSEDYNIEKMEALAQRRKSLILDIKRIIHDTRNAQQKSELLLRLAGLYMEDYYDELARAQKLYDIQLTDHAKNKKKKAIAPKFDNSNAMAALDRARAIYSAFLKNYPQHPRTDEVLYFLAMSSLDKSKTSEAMRYFERLSQVAPNSKYMNEALVQLGDHYFDNNKFGIALGYYNKLLDRKYAPLISYAMYKRAWCEYNEHQVHGSLEHFKWVINREGGNKNLRLKSEALRDIVLPFVELKQVEPAIAFFKPHGEIAYRAALENMATLYLEKGEHAASIRLNELLLTLDTNHPRNPTYDLQIINSMKLKSQDSSAVNRLFSRLPLYLENSNWYELNSSDPKAIKEAASLFEETARKYALEYHANAQKSKDDRYYSVAQSLYEKYLEHFARTPHAPQIRFYLAEILFRKEKYLAAATHYYQVYKEPSAGPLRVDSIKYTIIALDKQINIDRKQAGLSEINSKSTTKLTAKDDAVLEVVPFSPTEEKFFEVTAEYLKSYPDSKEAPDMLYQRAYLQYTHHELSDAYKSFWGLIQKYPSHVTAYGCAHLILDILNRKKDYEKLITACKKFLDTKPLSKPTFRSEVSGVLRQAELKRISLLEEKNEYKDAAQKYLEYTKVYGPQDEVLFEKALYNASINFTKASLFLEALDAQEKFLRRFPKSSFRENMVLQVAKSYELLALFEKSASYYEEFYRSYPSHSQAKNALRLSGLYYWGSNQLGKAQRAMQTFERAFPRDLKLIERDVLEIEKSTQNPNRLVQYYLQKRAQRGLHLAEYLSYTLRILEIQSLENGRPSPSLVNEAVKQVDRHYKEIARHPMGPEVLSKVLTWVALQKENAFHRAQLALPQQQIERNLKKKLMLIKELEQDYSRIAALGHKDLGLAAIYKTAALYRQLASEIAQAPVPAELSAEEVDKYRAELAKQMVTPFQEKALSLAVQCLDKSEEHNLLNHWTARCYSLAGELQPKRYPLVRTFYLPPLQLALIAPLKSDTKTQVGSLKRYAYPYYSAGLFVPTSDRMIASLSGPSLYDSQRRMQASKEASPVPMTYNILGGERRRILSSSLESERPADLKKGTSLAFLNLMRLTDPHRALPLVLEAIQRDPNNIGLHNILGLTHLETNNLPAAKVTWLSLIARDVKHASIWNNLAVAYYLEGDEATALSYFNEALTLDKPKEALTNLGYIALKYRNGTEAKKHFLKAAQLDADDATVETGLAIAKLQNREIEMAKEELKSLSGSRQSDPLAQLSFGYFLLDVENEPDTARKLLSDYANKYSAEQDLNFRQALNASEGGGKGSAGELPGIE